MQLIDCALVKVRMKAMVNVTTTMMGHCQVDTYEGDYYLTLGKQREATSGTELDKQRQES